MTLPPKTIISIKDEDVHMQETEGDAMVATGSPAQGPLGDHEPQENLDYDVADDNDWGPE